MTTSVVARLDTPPPPVRRVAPGAVGAVVGLAVLAAAARLLFLSSPLSADEAGFLTVAGQWRPGSSLYGDLWVDRPPGLVLLFSWADALGGQVALRVLGAMAAAASVVAGAHLAWRVARRDAAVVASAVTVAALVSSAFLQVEETNGELLGLPFLMLGLAALVTAYQRRTLAPAVVAGACAALAASVKQSLLDVVVAGLLLALVMVLRGRRRDAGLLLGGAVLGAAAVTVVLLAEAWTRGTAPWALWDALVTFRVQAGELVRTAASPATGERAVGVLAAGLATGAPLLAVVALLSLPWVRARRRAGVAGDPVWTWVAAAVVGFEVFSIALGGSYWWHYLVVLVPGTTLLVALAWPGSADRWWRRATASVLVGAVVVSGLASLGWRLGSPAEMPPGSSEAVALVRAEVQPGDTGVIAFGKPQLLREAGLRPAYEHLWSLPARVRDPRLQELTALLASDDRPDWVLVSGRGFGTWGIDPAAARRAGEVAREHYRVVGRTESFTVLRVTD